MKRLECFGGPLCGAKIPDTGEEWLAIAHVKNHSDKHFYRRMLLVAHDLGRQVMVWHYHGKDPSDSAAPLIMPHRRKFKQRIADG